MQNTYYTLDLEHRRRSICNMQTRFFFYIINNNKQNVNICNNPNRQCFISFISVTHIAFNVVP